MCRLLGGRWCLPRGDLSGLRHDESWFILGEMLEHDDLLLYRGEDMLGFIFFFFFFLIGPAHTYIQHGGKRRHAYCFDRKQPVAFGWGDTIHGKFLIPLLRIDSASPTSKKHLVINGIYNIKK